MLTFSNVFLMSTQASHFKTKFNFIWLDKGWSRKYLQINYLEKSFSLLLQSKKNSGFETINVRHCKITKEIQLYNFGNMCHVPPFYEFFYFCILLLQICACPLEKREISDRDIEAHPNTSNIIGPIREGWVTKC